MANYFPTQDSARLLKANSILYTGNTTTVGSTTFSPQTRQIRVVTNITGGIYIVTCDSTATGQAIPTVSNVTGALVAANNFPEYFTVNPGQMAAINSTSTSTGIVSIHEMSN